MARGAISPVEVVSLNGADERLLVGRCTSPSQQGAGQNQTTKHQTTKHFRSHSYLAYNSAAPAAVTTTNAINAIHFSRRPPGGSCGIGSVVGICEIVGTPLFSACARSNQRAASMHH